MEMEARNTLFDKFIVFPIFKALHRVDLGGTGVVVGETP
jgi:hypothetical protein